MSNFVDKPPELVIAALRAEVERLLDETIRWQRNYQQADANRADLRSRLETAERLLRRFERGSGEVAAYFLTTPEEPQEEPT
jgi:hypothetical protein